MVCNCIDNDSVDVAVVFWQMVIMTVVVLSNDDGVVVIW